MGGSETMVYMITYDLHEASGRDYTDLINKIKSCAVSPEGYCSYWESTHLIKSRYGIQRLYAKISDLIDEDDKVVIVSVSEFYDETLTEYQLQFVERLFSL